MVTGIVSKVFTRPFGNKTMYSLGLVNDKIYGFGGHNPNAQTGDTVEFEAAQNAKGYWTADKDTLKVTKGTAKTVSGASTGATAAAGGTGYWDRKETRDLANDRARELGASRNTAIEWVKFLANVEALKLPATQSKKEDALNSYLDDYTAKFMGSKNEKEPAAAVKAVEAVVEDQEADGTWN